MNDSAFREHVSAELREDISARVRELKMEELMKRSDDLASMQSGAPTDVEGGGMSDLEMTKLCADAMGLRVDHRWPLRGVYILPHKKALKGRYRYTPLSDDAQAMSLAKRLMMSLDIFAGCAELPVDVYPDIHRVYSDECINRAIVECAARMQRATGAQCPAGSSDNATPK